MRQLCDTNVLIALSFQGLPHNQKVLAWLDNFQANDTAEICRVVQISFFRVLTSMKLFGVNASPNVKALHSYEYILKDDRFKFCDAEPEGIEKFWFPWVAKAHSPQIWMDAYLAAFARAKGMQLVTFDKGFLRFKGLELLFR